MRSLTEDEAKVVFEKLANYIGRNISFLVDNATNPHVFRLQKDRVYYVSEQIANFATSVSRKQLMSVGTCFGKFTKTGKFKLHITALPYLSQYAKYKVWIKQNGEMPFLYGNHVLKAHIGRMSEDIPEHAGVIIYSMSDIPLGFGVSARSTNEARNLQPTAIVAFRQSDIGEGRVEVQQVSDLALCQVLDAERLDAVVAQHGTCYGVVALVWFEVGVPFLQAQANRERLAASGVRRLAQKNTAFVETEVSADQPQDEAAEFEVVKVNGLEVRMTVLGQRIGGQGVEVVNGYKHRHILGVVLELVDEELERMRGSDHAKLVVLQNVVIQGVLVLLQGVVDLLGGERDVSCQRQLLEHALVGGPQLADPSLGEHRAAVLFHLSVEDVVAGAVDDLLWVVQMQQDDVSFVLGHRQRLCARDQNGLSCSVLTA